MGICEDLPGSGISGDRYQGAREKLTALPRGDEAASLPPDLGSGDPWIRLLGPVAVGWRLQVW